MRVAVLQMTSGIDPAENAVTISEAANEAARGGATMMFTPEMSGLIDRDRARARRHITSEANDVVLAQTRAAAKRNAIWIALGSLAVAGEGADGRFANRSFMIDPDGTIIARYDKIHLFDVDLPTGESWRESGAYAPGQTAVLADMRMAKIGLSVCYDLRFPELYRALTDAGATIVSVPSAFTVPTGEAHWHILLRARAIEAGAFVIAAAQTGTHADGRQTYGHSLVVDPWGEVLLDMGEAPGLAFCDLDLAVVEQVRARIPAIAHRRPIVLG